MKNRNKSTKRAFTLIELLIVIAIIGILFVVLVSKVDFATDKAKATGVQTDFRSFQMAFETVSKENAGFASLGWDTGDENGNRKRDSYDEGDTNTNNIMESTETWTGHKVPGETWTGTYTLINPDDNADKSAFKLLEDKVNANLDPKLHITITPEENAGVLTGNAKVTMANAAKDPWKNEYHGVYITNAQNDKADRGAFIIYSNGANGQWGSEHDIANGKVSIIVPGNNVRGKDDMSIVVCYTYVNGYGEVLNMTTGFSNNQNFLGAPSNGQQSIVPGGNAGGNGGDEPDVNEPMPVVISATFTDGTTLTWEELQVPENGTKYGYRAATITNTSVGDYAFLDCTSLKSIIIPNSVTSISESAFRNCSSLSSIEIANSVKSIGNSAFQGCSSLKDVYIINLDAWCKISFSNSYSNPTYYGANLHLNGHLVTEMTIPNTVESLKYTFINCKSIVNVTISDGVKSIGENVFSGCTSLKSVVIGDSVTEIGSQAFYNCNGLTSVTIGNGVTSIGDWAFHSCSSLTNVVIGDRVATIGSCAFYRCTSLTSITIPDSVTSLGDKAFYACKGLTNVILGKNVNSIEYNTFENCIQLASIVIPDSVTSIGNYAFSGCSSLKDVCYTGSEVQWAEISIGTGNPYLTGATMHYNYQ